MKLSTDRYSYHKDKETIQDAYRIKLFLGNHSNYLLGLQYISEILQIDYSHLKKIIRKNNGNVFHAGLGMYFGLFDDIQDSLNVIEYLDAWLVAAKLNDEY